MEPSQPSESAQKALRQAELLKQKLMLTQQFQSNMEFLKENNPSLFEEYKEYQPEHQRLQFTENGHINLVNMANESLVFPEDAKSYCQDYLQDYLDDPFFRVTNPARPPENKQWLLHVRQVTKLTDMVMKESPKRKRGPFPPHVPFLLMYGVGLGYQFDIIERREIDHLLILEPHKDIFFASLHTTDWKKIFQYFSQQGKSMLLMVGLSDVQTLSDTTKYIGKIGPFTTPFIYTYCQLKSPKIDQRLEDFYRGIGESVANLGFFDDEQISLAHSIANYKVKYPILRKIAQVGEKDARSIPVMICGSGPSLDRAAPFIKEHQDKALVLSCGSSLRALNRYGIKPDFHIEMERTKPVLEWVKLAADDDFIKDTILIALNTVHPEVVSHFERQGLCLKGNDLGSIILRDAFKDNGHVELYNSNPTVGNTGMAVATAMGFKNIFIFGIDFGFKEKGEHHTKMSLYKAIEEKGHESVAAFKTDGKDNYPYPGNEGDTVLTNDFYARARLNYEMILREFSDVECRNGGVGVKIKGADFFQPEESDFPFPPIADKKVLATKVFSEHFSNEGLLDLKDDASIKAIFEQVISVCESLGATIHEVKNFDEANQFLAEHQGALMDMLQKKEFNYIHQLLKGSVGGLSFCLMRLLTCGEDEEAGVRLFNEGLEHYRQFFKEAVPMIEEGILLTNQTVKNLDQLVK
jgi:hypothetical protein